MTTDPTAAVWIDGDPLMEAIAAAVWEQCGRSDSGACVEDDPRNIAAVAATVARTQRQHPDRDADVLVAEARRDVHESLILLPAREADRVRSLIADLETAVEFRAAAPAVVAPPTNRADLRDRIAEAIRAAACPGDCGKTEEECARERIQPFVWHHGKLAGVEGSPEQFADAVLAVLGEPTDRAAHACGNCSGIDPDSCLFNPDRPRAATPSSPTATLTATERDVLCSALDLAEEEMLARGDDEDQLEALESLRRLAVEAHDTGTQQQGEAQLASLAVNAANALRDEKRHYEIACQENARLRAAIERVRAAIHIADDEDVTDWQRGFRACHVVATQALDEPAPVAQQPAALVRSGDATVDPAMCPRCKGDNSEAFELCTTCALAEQQAAAADGEETLCRCGHGKAYHDAKYADPQCRLCPEDGERSWRHPFTPNDAPRP